MLLAVGYYFVYYVVSEFKCELMLNWMVIMLTIYSYYCTIMLKSIHCYAYYDHVL